MNFAFALLAIVTSNSPELREVQFVPWQADTFLPMTSDRIRDGRNLGFLFKDAQEEIYKALRSANYPAEFSSVQIRFRAVFENKEEFLVDRYGVVYHNGKSCSLSVKQFRVLREELEALTPITASGRPHDHLNPKMFRRLRFR